MGLWNLVVSGWQHARIFGHWPDWQSFNGWLICERCLRPPSRPLRMAPAWLQRSTLRA